MKEYLKVHPWKIMVDDFERNYHRVTESVFSIGNGKFGQRGNLEEYYSGDSLLGNYVSGVYYPDKTRVGWWKNGYPEYFAKVLNAPNWVGIKTILDGVKMDLHTLKVTEYQSALDMKKGLLSKELQVEFPDGRQIAVKSNRFISLADDEVAAIHYQWKAINFSGNIEVIVDLDGDVRNSDANYDEKFWKGIDQSADLGFIRMETKKTAFQVCNAMKVNCSQNVKRQKIESEDYVGWKYSLQLEKGKPVDLTKYVSVSSSFYHNEANLVAHTLKTVEQAFDHGFERLFGAHVEAWEQKWREGDIVIQGDEEAQQGIRFNIFQLNQTYTGDDPRLNIGPKGMTGEKYGGSTYWDTEAYCLPFYMSSAKQEVSLNLLRYRYRHLPKAIENAEKLGFSDGAALYPMVTMNGEECHNEWEITFEEIHRNGAIAYAIFNYIRYFDDPSYLKEGGLEVLIGIARFWAQRVNWSDAKQQYVILGVTGPNEYENNVNNNWYTNRMAQWCLNYTMECIDWLKAQDLDKWGQIQAKSKFENEEIQLWKSIVGQIYLPYDEERAVFVQQDGFFDKVIQPAESINPQKRPIHENWSWDRILRSCYIKQADVLQGLWFLEHFYDREIIARNFRFYEPLTVHESSLSSCIHSIQANLIGEKELAYDYYLNASRLDLDDYNNDTCDGLHITSMGGTWMTLVYGFAGMRVQKAMLSFEPSLPEKWKSLSFQMMFRGAILSVHLTHEGMRLENNGARDISCRVNDIQINLEAKTEKSIRYEA